MSALPDFAEAWIAGVASADQADRLQAWLREDGEHARAVMRAMRLHQALREGHQGAEAAPAERARKASLRLAPRRRRARASWAPIAAAAGLPIAGLVWMLSSSTHHAAVEREAMARIDAVRGLSSTVASDGVSSAVGIGHLITADDEIAVAEGELVTLSYDDGTRIELSHGARTTFPMRDGGKTIDIKGGTVSGLIAKQPAGRPMR